MTIEPITDPATVAKWLTLIEDMIDKPWHLNEQWVARHRWVAVPVESASHFAKRDAELLSQAAASKGCFACVAVATEPLENSIVCYRVPSTPNGFLEFSHEVTALNYLLLSEDRSFAVLCTSEDYYIIAGPRDFVTRALGTSIDMARKMFLEFADDQLWPDSERKLLIAVAQKYEPYNG